MPVNQATFQGISITPGMVLQIVQAVLFLFLLVAVSVCDIKSREIPDRLQAAIALLCLLQFSLWNLAGVLAALPYLLVALAGPGTGGIGGGDIKLAAAIGLVLGLPASLTASLMGLAGFIAFGLACSAIKKLKGRKERAAYPVGPFLASGAAIAYFMKTGGWIV